jgi:hypothetical protein
MMLYLISMQKLPTSHAKKGQVLISLLVASALFAILGHALFSLISASFTLVGFTRARIAARHLAQEQMELIRNLPYDEIGTVGGIPDGPFEQVEGIEKNGLYYTVSTSIIYVDDPFDNTSPSDLLPTDYKRVRVDVSWEGLGASRKNPITLVADIAPQGIETSVGGGTLSILVFDANAVPVPQANVLIVATETDPQVNVTLQTADNGRVILPGTPTCTSSCYQITVSKSRYSSDRTYSTSEVTNPIKPHASVLEGDLTEISFAIDELSSIEVESVSGSDNDFESLPNVVFNIRGEKIIGTDSFDDPVYKYEDSFTTDSSGKVTLEDIEWDNYQISVNPADGLDIVGTNPLIPLEILPDEDVDLVFASSNHTTHSLLVAITDPSSTPIASVSARLYDDGGFEATGSSGLVDNPDFGQVFFSDLTSQIYHFQATVSDFLDFNGDISVGGNTHETIILSPE